MRNIVIVMALSAGIGASTQAQAIGCFTGGAAGAVAGHYAGNHAVVGAVGGCIAGHEMHKKQVANKRLKQQDQKQTDKTVE